MSRVAWAIAALLALVTVGWASLAEGRDFWPYALAARGAVSGITVYAIWLGRTHRALEFARAWRFSGAVALGATAWCCIPVTGNVPRPWIEAGTHALGAAVALAGLAALALLGAAKAWGRGPEPL